MTGPLPMFPLGSPLMPYQVLPLQVFEPRYRVMLRRVTEGNGAFGVVMIERGSEVGGGDQRSRVGTLARVFRAEELSDGRWVLLAAGAARLRVREWLPDDPHPLARIEILPEPERPDPAACDDLRARVVRLAALLTELGDPAPPLDLELGSDLGPAVFRAMAYLPVGAYDGQRILGIDHPEERLRTALEILDGMEDLLRFRLRGDPAP